MRAGLCVGIGASKCRGSRTGNIDSDRDRLCGGNTAFGCMESGAGSAGPGRESPEIGVVGANQQDCRRGDGGPGVVMSSADGSASERTRPITRNVKSDCECLCKVVANPGSRTSNTSSVEPRHDIPEGENIGLKRKLHRGNEVGPRVRKFSTSVDKSKRAIEKAGAGTPGCDRDCGAGDGPRCSGSRTSMGMPEWAMLDIATIGPEW